MSHFAIIKTGGKQCKVSEGEEIEVEKIDGKAGDKVKFDKVLMTSNKGKVVIGKPLVARAKVDAEIVEQSKGKKVRILKFRAKSRYRRRMGHRQQLTRVRILKL